MNYAELFEALMLQLGYKPSAQQIADIIGLSRQSVYTRSQRPDQKFTLEELLKIEQALNVELVNKSLKLSNLNLTIPQENETKLKGRSYSIQYWEGECAELIKKDGVDDVNIDLQIIINEWKLKPENLIFIAMPGDEMNGGDYPLKNGDILIIDTSQTDIATSGIYFITTQDSKRVFVRRLVELMNGDVVVSVDNPVYAQFVNKTLTMEHLEVMDFKVVGRVVKNMSYMC